MATNTTTAVRIQSVVSDMVPHDKLLFHDKPPIGSGAFGVVYKMFHKDWGCLVAYKKLGIHFINDENHIKDLRNEANIHRQLRHPNIVSMLGVVFEDNNYGLILEYVGCGSLDKFLQNMKEKTGIPFQVCWSLKNRMCYDVCCGMSYLHTLEPTHVIHGDLKQQNLLVTDSLNIKISDFGLSKWKDYSRTHTHAGILQGTASHIPPEHWRHEDLSKNEKFDVYSYGILLWEMFTEERAFEKRNHVIRSIVMDGERPSLDKLPSNTPFQIAKIISACWEQEPPKRPTFTELFSRIKDLIQGTESLSKIERAVMDALKVYHGGYDTTQPLSEHGLKMNQVHRKLCSILRRMDQILTQLHQTRAITSQEHDELRSQSTIYDVTKHLIDVLGSKPVTAYESFLDTLKVTDQQYLYNLLELGVELNIDHREVLIDNFVYLRKNLNVSNTGLLDHLLQSRVLDEQELCEIQSKITTDERAEQLLKIVLRTSQQQYQHFLSALRASGHSFIAEKLDDGNQVRQQQQPGVPEAQIIPQSAPQLLGLFYYPPLRTSLPTFRVPTSLPPFLLSLNRLPTSSLLPSLSTPYRLPTEITSVIESESIYVGVYSKAQVRQFLQWPQRCETNTSLLGLTNPVELRQDNTMASGYQNKWANTMISFGLDQEKQRSSSEALTSATSFRNRTELNLFLNLNGNNRLIIVPQDSAVLQLFEKIIRERILPEFSNFDDFSLFYNGKTLQHAGGQVLAYYDIQDMDTLIVVQRLPGGV